MVSWIVVAGSLAWLLYGQLRSQFSEADLAGIAPEAVRGTVKPRGPGQSGAQPEALPHVIAYADLYPLLRSAASSGVERQSDSVPTIIRSSRSGVQPSEIRLTLDDGTRVHRFPVNRRGEVHLPLRTDWRDDNRQIVSNQPEGTLAVEVPDVERFGVAPHPDVLSTPMWAAHPDP
jgi:hypothetical protein